MNSINSSGFDNSLYARKLRVNAAKTAEISSFEAVLQNTLYADRVTASGTNTTGSTISEPNTSLRWYDFN